MNMREGISKWKEVHQMGDNYYGVRTVDNGDIFLWADRMLVNESGSLIFLRKLDGGNHYPVMAFGAREYVCSFEADNKTNRPKAVELGWEK